MKRFCYDGVLERWKVKLALQRARRMGFRDDELDDVIQELVLKLLTVKYDAERADGAKEKTVLTAVIDRQLAKMRRAETRRQDWEQEVALSGDESYDNSDLLRRWDVETVVGMLDERQQRVCDLLSQRHSKSTIARELGCGWHRIDEIIRDIRLKFKQHGFGEE